MFITHYFSVHLPEGLQTNFKIYRRHASTYSATAHEKEGATQYVTMLHLVC